MSVLFCDSDCELWYDQIERLGINYFKMPYTIDGKETFFDLGKTTDIGGFYKRVREGAMPITSALNPDMYESIIEPIFAAGEDILYIAFGRNYSATFDHLDTALKNLKEKYPQRKLTLFDTKSISVPCGMQVRYAAELKQKGATDEEIIAFLNDFTNHIGVYFVVDSLMHIYRGGRMSKSKAMLGGMLGVKPVLTHDEKGKLKVVDKIMGKKHAARFLAEKVVENARRLDEYDVYVIDADNAECADMVTNIIKKKLPQARVVRQPIGPVIGTHCGPGTLAVVYYADERVIPLEK